MLLCSLLITSLASLVSIMAYIKALESGLPQAVATWHRDRDSEREKEREREREKEKEKERSLQEDVVYSSV